MRPRGAEDEPGDPTAAQQARIRVILDSLRAVNPRKVDSVYNGADDDGSGSMAVLEIAESLAAQPTKPKRSVLFVWHTAEEKGLFGSEHFGAHPTVPRDSIVAQVNIDMIGRGRATDLANGGPQYLQLIGSRRLSTQLGDLVERVNRDRGYGFQLDYAYDAVNHPDQYYCRSDHYNYARWGIPVVFFSTGGHRDYHQLTDEPQYLDYDHYARVTTYIRDLVLAVADAPQRLVVDKPKPDPNGQCRQ
jgi:Zn-dependent M28 family amino/carboxypeptidase